jgi:excisionase family DNA binding protein
MRLLTIRDTAELLGVDVRTVYRLIDREGLPAFKVGRQWRMRAGDMETWIDARLRARKTGVAYLPRQTGLFGPVPSGAEGAEHGKSGLRDSAFSENNGLPVHRWVPWIAGFSAGFVADTLDRHLAGAGRADGRLVLDPFAGVGTTLVVAMLRGHAVCGFEINPFAAEACDLKIHVDRIPAEELARRIGEFRRVVRDAILSGRAPTSVAPPGFRTRAPFFSPLVLRKVLLVKDYVSGLQDEWVKRCFRLALASELVGFSNYSYEPSLCRRVTAGRAQVVDAPVVTTVSRKLAWVLEDVRAAQERLSMLAGSPARRLVVGDFFSANSCLADGSVDLVVTSPPYLNNYHYIRNSRPQAYWLDLVTDPQDLKRIEHESFGTFWQTVRGEEPVELEFSLPALQSDIELLRERRAERGPYGGPGWANYAGRYFNDCHRFARALRRLLRPGAAAVVVLGNSILQGVEFRTDEVFGRICELLGLRMQEIRLLRRKRTGTSIVGSSVRADAPARKTMLYETAVVVRQPA